SLPMFSTEGGRLARPSRTVEGELTCSLRTEGAHEIGWGLVNLEAVRFGAFLRQQCVLPERLTRRVDLLAVHADPGFVLALGCGVVQVVLYDGCSIGDELKLKGKEQLVHIFGTAAKVER